MNDGTVGWNPGKNNPDVIKPAGTIDPDVPVLFFEIDRPTSRWRLMSTMPFTLTTSANL